MTTPRKPRKPRVPRKVQQARIARQQREAHVAMCHYCGVTVWAGLDDDRTALTVQADAAPITERYGAALAAEGWPVFELVPQGGSFILERFGEWPGGAHARRGEVLRGHKCWWQRGETR